MLYISSWTCRFMSFLKSLKFFKFQEDEDDEEDEDLSVNHSSGTLKSYSKRKLSTDDKDDLDSSEELTASESKTTVTIQLQDHPGGILAPGGIPNAQPVFQSSYVDVQDEVSDLRDEDIIEAVPGTVPINAHWSRMKSFHSEMFVTFKSVRGHPKS